MISTSASGGASIGGGFGFAAMTNFGGAMLSAFSRGASSTSTSTARRAPETRIYYKCDDERTLSVRVETVIERDLLVPLLSVLNESELYSEWLPRWTTPTRLGVRSSEKVAQVGRCSQLVVITCDAPWPLETRQVVLDARAFDDMETSGDIGVLLRTRDCDLPNIFGQIISIFCFVSFA